MCLKQVQQKGDEPAKIISGISERSRRVRAAAAASGCRHCSHCSGYFVSGRARIVRCFKPGRSVLGDYKRCAGACRIFDSFREFSKRPCIPDKPALWRRVHCQLSAKRVDKDLRHHNHHSHCDDWPRSILDRRTFVWEERNNNSPQSQTANALNCGVYLATPFSVSAIRSFWLPTNPSYR